MGSELTGLCNYGCAVRLADGLLELTPVVGACIPTDIFVHEFSHGYANILMEAQWDKSSAKFERLCAPIAELMSSQAYTGPQVYMLESVTRANTAVFIKDRIGKLALEQELAKLDCAGFSVVRPILEQLLLTRQTAQSEWCFASYSEVLGAFLADQL